MYGSVQGFGGRNENIELPDYEEAVMLKATRKNMTLMFLWNRYKKKCEEEGVRFYQYSQYCELYKKYCKENYENAHFEAVIAQKMEVDFAGQTFSMTDPLTGEIITIVVFVAGYTGAVKPPVRMTGNRESGHKETGMCAAEQPSRRRCSSGRAAS